MNRQNLGYSGQVTLNIPVWNWGVTRSKIQQAEFKRAQSQLDLSLAERTLQGNIGLGLRRGASRPGATRFAPQFGGSGGRESAPHPAALQAGEANALEVVDAQTTVTQARNAYDDGLARYRVALATLQTLTGTL